MQYPRVDRCPIDVYIASNMPYDYPYKLVKPKYVSQRVVDSAITTIMDSGIGDDTTNAEVIDLATEYDTDFVVACDELNDIEATVANIHEFMDIWNDSDCRATPLIPLQPPHVDCYNRLDIDAAHYMLGGIGGKSREVSTTDIMHSIEQFRQVDAKASLHLLGIGANHKLMQWLSHPHRQSWVQSLDCSTPDQCVINGEIYDISLKRQSFETLTGDGCTVSVYGLAKELALILNDAIFDLFRTETQTVQTTL